MQKNYQPKTNEGPTKQTPNIIKDHAQRYPYPQACKTKKTKKNRRGEDRINGLAEEGQQDIRGEQAIKKVRNCI